MRNVTRIERLSISIEEAKRFIKKAEIALDFLELNSLSKYPPYASHEFAAAKRASLDLSKELANLRKAKVWDKIKGEK